MVRSHRQNAASDRRGVILLIVISLLVLFALVGLAFVIYAQSQANIARIGREAETMQRPDLDPELLFAYFLGQLLYDTDNPYSALRGHSLARNMYGRPGSTMPFNGTGRIHTGNPDDFLLVNYTQFGGVARNPDRYGSPNPPYTYPDLNHVFLAAVQGSDGRVLIPSYHRGSMNGFGSLDPANPNWNNPAMRTRVLRPLPVDHAGFPPPQDAGGDVRNLADSPGYFDPASGQWCANDSIWLDLGFPVMTTPDGRKFKPLFAPHVQDLDNRVNVNIHGNVLGFGPSKAGLNPGEARHLSNQGVGPWEVNVGKVIAAQEGALPEARRLLAGNGSYPGRLDLNFWGQPGFVLPAKYTLTGKFYSLADNDLDWPDGLQMSLPGIPKTSPGLSPHYLPDNPPTCCFVRFSRWHYNNKGSAEAWSHPQIYNYFDPAQNTYAPGPQDRRFAPGNMEALLRYADMGSPALSSDLFRLCPLSFGDPGMGGKARRLVTTHSMDLDRPGVAPWIWDPAAQPYRLAPHQQYPTGGAMPFPGTTVGTSPMGSDFAMDRSAVTARLGRIDLNRDLPDYPAPDLVTRKLAAGKMAAFRQAQTARQLLAAEIFECLRQVTGAAAPAAGLEPAQQDALRWLAQLAVNIVDYRDEDDCATPFRWMPGEWVFGVELPRVLLNEVYAECVDDPADPLAAQKKASRYHVNVWVELHNPFWDDFRISAGTAFLDKAYQVVIAKDSTPNELLKNANVTGNPREIHQTPTGKDALVGDFTGAEAVDNEYQLFPHNGTKAVPTGKAHYLLGPERSFPQDPGAANVPAATLKRREMTYRLDDLTLPRPTVLLRRLACPHLPEQGDPGLADYNPFITIDYAANIPLNDAAARNANGVKAPTPVDKRSSLGRRQPYAAGDDPQLQARQAPMPALTGQPQHTFLKHNDPVSIPFDWLTFMDRNLISPIELLQVPAGKPHQLTQQFMTVDGAGQVTRFSHRAPWYEPDVRIYRFLEFVRATMALQGMPSGSRLPGKINVNTVWDVETFRALCDAQPNSYFATDPQTGAFNGDTNIDVLFQQLRQRRSPRGFPAAEDRPFLGMAAPHVPAGDAQYPNGAGIDATFFAASAAHPNQRVFETPLPAIARDHPYLKSLLLSKIYNQLTTRSNVFGVWVTVGFFEVVDDSAANRPPILGPEIGRAENRQVRHRLFAIVDRTNLTLDPANAGNPGAAPFFVTTTAPVAAGAKTVAVSAVSGEYEEVPLLIRAGDRLSLDCGLNQEQVTVTTVNLATRVLTLAAPLTRRHESGVPVTNVGAATQFGNPGPQPRFDPRNAAFRGVVRHFSIIE